MRIHVADVAILLSGVPSRLRLETLCEPVYSTTRDLAVQIYSVPVIQSCGARGEPMYSPEWVFEKVPYFIAVGTAMKEIEVYLNASSHRMLEVAWLSFARFLVSEVLLRAGGIALHAAAIARPKGAVVLMADSGQGKTTVARLFGQGCVLADDICLIVPTTTKFIVIPSPFPGRERLPATANTSPLWMLVKMSKSSGSYFEPISRADAIASILRHAIGGEGPTGRKLLLDTAIKLIHNAGIGHLGVSLEQDPFEVLEKRDERP